MQGILAPRIELSSELLTDELLQESFEMDLRDCKRSQVIRNYPRNMDFAYEDSDSSSCSKMRTAVCHTRDAPAHRLTYILLLLFLYLSYFIRSAMISKLNASSWSALHCTQPNQEDAKCCQLCSLYQEVFSARQHRILDGFSAEHGNCWVFFI